MTLLFPPYGDWKWSFHRELCLVQLLKLLCLVGMPLVFYLLIVL